MPGRERVPERLASGIQKVLERSMAERVFEDRLGTPKVFAFSLKRVRVKRVMRGNSQGRQLWRRRRGPKWWRGVRVRVRAGGGSR